MPFVGRNVTPLTDGRAFCLTRKDIRRKLARVRFRRREVRRRGAEAIIAEKPRGSRPAMPVANLYMAKSLGAENVY